MEDGASLQTFLAQQSRPLGINRVHCGAERWPPIYIQRPSSGPLVDMRGIGTEEASHHYPANSIRLEADPVPLE